MMIKRILTATKPNKSPELNAIIFEYSYMPVEYRPTSTSIGTAAIIAIVVIGLVLILMLRKR